MFTVCIDALDEGGYRVYSELPQDAAAETAMPEVEGEGANEQVVETVKEALTVALEALRSEGKITEADQQEKAFNAAVGAKSA